MPHPAISPNHVAVITGGASGIGLAAAMRFAALGMKVCIADLGADRLTEAETKLSSVAPDGARQHHDCNGRRQPDRRRVAGWKPRCESGSAAPTS